MGQSNPFQSRSGCVENVVSSQWNERPIHHENFCGIQNGFLLIDAYHKMMQNLQCKSFYANNLAVWMPNFEFNLNFQKGYMWDVCVILRSIKF